MQFRVGLLFSALSAPAEERVLATVSPSRVYGPVIFATTGLSVTLFICSFTFIFTFVPESFHLQRSSALSENIPFL